MQYMTSLATPRNDKPIVQQPSAQLVWCPTRSFEVVDRLVIMSAFVTALPDEYARHLSTLKDRVRPARVRVRSVVGTSKHGSSSAREGASNRPTEAQND